MGIIIMIFMTVWNIPSPSKNLINTSLRTLTNFYNFHKVKICFFSIYAFIIKVIFAFTKIIEFHYFLFFSTKGLLIISLLHLNVKNFLFCELIQNSSIEPNNCSWCIWRYVLCLSFCESNKIFKMLHCLHNLSE